MAETHEAATTWIPVASHMSTDDATGARIASILEAAGIKSVQAGSLGTTTSVAESDAERAREILGRAKRDEKLPLEVINADGSLAEVAPAGAVPKHLAARPQLFVRDGDRIESAPAADHVVASRYARFADKGAVKDGLRVTILSEKNRYAVGETIRVIHVLEAPHPGRDVYIMGPKSADDEHVDGVRRTGATPVEDYPWVGVYDGAVLPSPAVDYNYEITTYKLEEPGVHTIQWKPGPLKSNVLTIEVAAH